MCISLQIFKVVSMFNQDLWNLTTLSEKPTICDRNRGEKSHKVVKLTQRGIETGSKNVYKHFVACVAVFDCPSPALTPAFRFL